MNLCYATKSGLANWAGISILRPLQDAWETEPVIADTQFSATNDLFQTNNAVRRFIKMC